MDIEERKEAFEWKVWRIVTENDRLKDYPKWMLREFCNYWEQMNDGGRKMFFEMEKKWSTLGRLATAKTMVYGRDPRWKQEEQIKHPDWYNKAHAAAISPQQYQGYKKHLEGLGFTFGGSVSGGQFVKPPNKEMIWL